MNMAQQEYVSKPLYLVLTLTRLSIQFRMKAYVLQPHQADIYLLPHRASIAD